MTREPRIRISRRDADRVLAGEEASAPTVAALLAAARRPTPAEAGLTGETEALASFRVAQAAVLAPVVTRKGRIAAARAAAIAALSTKLAAGAVAALAAGGVVLAASTGVLPGTGDHPRHHEPTTSASPTPDLRGLCTAYRAEVGDAPGKALSNPAYSALVSAAQPDTVTNYCTALLATDTNAHRPTSHPTGQSNPSRPSATPAPTTHPTGKPTTLPRPLPTQARTSRPTASPAPHPRVVPPSHR